MKLLKVFTLIALFNINFADLIGWNRMSNAILKMQSARNVAEKKGKNQYWKRFANFRRNSGRYFVRRAYVPNKYY